MAGPKVSALVLMAVAGMALAGCQDGAQPFGFMKKKDSAADSANAGGDTAATPKDKSVKLVDRDVEAPDVFQVTSKGLWDGRPSLGGVWAAYPNVKDPERVIIRNPANGKFVIGALFRREINNPGPKLQLSSDAATALGLVAGEPATVSVTALRREEAPVAEPDAKKPALDANEQVTQKPLADVAASASAAIDKAQGKTAAKTAATATATTAPKKPVARPETLAAATAAKPATASAAKPASRPVTKPAPKPAPKPAKGGRDYLQIGIFSVEANANRAADMVSKAGAMVEIKTEASHGKKFWRVLAGPATTTAQRGALLARVKKLGFNDAFYVRG